LVYLFIAVPINHRPEFGAPALECLLEGEQYLVQP